MHSEAFVDAVAVILVFAKALIVVVSVTFLVSGIDDLFVDACFWVWRTYRRLLVMPRYHALTEEDLLSAAEQPLAVLIPAWDESAVIRKMLENTLSRLNYTNYHVFVGTYRNDLATQLEVDEVVRRYPNVHRIVTPHDGPTNKADCLNWVYQGIRKFEREAGIEFEIHVMQDCEDVIHPLCYKLFNRLIPRKDMVQVPVLSLPRRWFQFTGGHYIDEFAQLHFKDLLVRELLNRSIPAAGVGCAFSRRAFMTIAKENKNQLFSIDSLTEDYDFGFRLQRHGFRQIFAKVAIGRPMLKRSVFSGKVREVTVPDLICIREYFPANRRAAVRQKARWVVGITMQGWAKLGWQGSLWIRYMLYRDRKSLLTNLMNVLGYAVVVLVVSVWVASALSAEAYRYPPLVEPGSWLWNVMIVNGLLLAVRLHQRAYCVYRLHGWRQALLSAPRMVWGNLINFFATCRAIRLYARYLRTGKLIAWDKTSHVYPSEEELQPLTHSAVAAVNPPPAAA